MSLDMWSSSVKSYQVIPWLLLLFGNTKQMNQWANIEVDTLTYLDPEEMDCPYPEDLIPDLFYSSDKIPLGVFDRALRTVPEKWVYVAESNIKGAGLGVFAATFIPAHTWLAEYKGEIVTMAEAEKGMDYSYSWAVTKDLERQYYIDAMDESISNWIRYINCPLHITRENTQVAMCYGHIYYRTLKDLAPGEELLSDYGYEYLPYIDIDPEKYYDVNSPPS